MQVEARPRIAHPPSPLPDTHTPDRPQGSVTGVFACLPVRSGRSIDVIMILHALVASGSHVMEVMLVA